MVSLFVSKLKSFIDEFKNGEIPVKRAAHPARQHEDGITTSLTVLIKPENGIVILSIYDNKDQLSDCLYKVLLDADSKDFNQQLGDTIHAAYNKLATNGIP